MRYRGRNLLICMPTERRALVDLLLYLEKNFSVLPQEISDRSLAFDLLRTMRLSLSADMRNMDKDGDCRAPTIEVRTTEPSASQAAR
jgi:hypothetical protein